MDLHAMKEGEDGCGGHIQADTAASSGSTDGLKDSLNGLNLGKRTYFQDAGASGGGGPAKPMGNFPATGANPASSSQATPKRARGLVQSGQPPMCQVEDCKADLTGAKAYYCRHKVCGMHSKSPKVIVAGVEQRFCQQCSRFHQLSEFDQGKRSCRRRLAGHNARRRKPPHNSISSHFGRFPSSLYEDGRIGGLLTDFTFPRHAGKDVWPTIRASDHVPNQVQAAEKYVPHVWQGDASAADILSPGVHRFLQGSSGGSGFSSQEISPGNCFSGVSDPGCALSLLSPQPLGSKGPASGLIAVNHLLNDEEACITPSPGAQPSAGVNADKLLAVSSQWSAPFPPFTAYSPTAILQPLSPVRTRASGWSFRSNEASNSQDIQSDMELKQVPELHGSQFPGELELVPQGGRQLMDPGHMRSFGPSNHNPHWGL